MCGALSQIVDVPAGNRLWFDTADIAALQDGEMERGQAALVRAQALLALVQAGYTHESAIAAVDAMDLSQLKAGGIGTPTSGPQVQHMLGAGAAGCGTASPLPPTLGRLPVGPASAGWRGDGSRPVPRPASARRAIEAAPEPDEWDSDPDETDGDWEDGDDLDLDELLADAETPVDENVARFNPFHAKAGSPTGGQFATSSGASSGNTTKPSTGGHGGHGGHGGTATSPRAAEKAHLLAAAKDDRAQAHRLEDELHALLKQMRASVAAHKHATASAHASAAAAKKAGQSAKHAKTAAAKTKAAAHHRAASHHRATARHHHRHARSLHSRVSALRTRIHTLLAQAKSLDAQAAKL